MPPSPRRSPHSPRRKSQHQRPLWLPLRHLPPRGPSLRLPAKVAKAGGLGGGGGPSATCLSRLPSSDVPSAPQLLTVQDVSDRAVTVSWEPPERLGRPGLRGYVLELRREGGEPGPAGASPEEMGRARGAAPVTSAAAPEQEGGDAGLPGGRAGGGERRS